MGAFRVVQLKVGPMDNFAYVLTDTKSKESIVIDSGWETKPIVKAVRDAGAKVKLAVATHEHFDHTSTLEELAAALGAKVAAHESSPIAHDVSLADGDEISLGANGVKVLHTPGHTQDSICLYDGDEVFTGDTVFVGNIGRFEENNAAQIYHSIYDRILGLPGSTAMYPGHDYGDVPFRTLKEERAANPYLRARSVSEFVSSFGRES